MQLQFARMDGLWPDEKDILHFQVQAEYFMKRVQGLVCSLIFVAIAYGRLSVQVMECLAEGLGLDKSTFTEGTVDPGVGDSQSVLRLLHYHPTEGKSFGPNFWRAGAHADFDVLTMVRIANRRERLLMYFSSSRKMVKVASRSVQVEKLSETLAWVRTGYLSRPVKTESFAILETNSCV